jgi:predicted translation initiation factor SUI1
MRGTLAAWAVACATPAEVASVRNTSRPSVRPGIPDDGIVRIARAKRRASTVSIVTGIRESELDETAKALKRHCGTGGTAKNGTIEIQGDHREKIAAWFAAAGKKAKLAGG